jgi:hypothetical protein
MTIKFTLTSSEVYLCRRLLQPTTFARLNCARFAIVCSAAQVLGSNIDDVLPFII